MTPDQINTRFAALSEDITRGMRGYEPEELARMVEEVQMSCITMISTIVLLTMRPAGFPQVIEVQTKMLTDMLTSANQDQMVRACIQPDMAERILKALHR